MASIATRITIDGLRLYAYHGLLPQERVVGAYFVVTVEAEQGEGGLACSDQIADTIDYAALSRVVEEEMAVSGNLLESVAHRIVGRLTDEWQSLARVRVRIVKENPPLGVECRGAGVEVTFTR